MCMFLDNYSMMGQQNTMSSQGYNNMRSQSTFSNSQMLLQQPQRRYNVKVDKTIGPVILRYDPIKIQV